MEINSNTITIASKPKAPRNKLGHLVLTIGVSSTTKFTPKIRVLTPQELTSIEKRRK